VKIGGARGTQYPETAARSLDSELKAMFEYLEKQHTVLATLRSCQIETKAASAGGGARRQRSLSKGFLVVTLRLEEPKPREWQHNASQIGSSISSDIIDKPQHHNQNHSDHYSISGRRWEQKPAAPTSGVADDADAFDSNKDDEHSRPIEQQRYSSMRVKSQLAAIWNENKGDGSTDNWSDDDDDDDIPEGYPTSASIITSSSSSPSSSFSPPSSSASSSFVHPPELYRTQSEATMSIDSRYLEFHASVLHKGTYIVDVIES